MKMAPNRSPERTNQKFLFTVQRSSLDLKRVEIFRRSSPDLTRVETFKILGRRSRQSVSNQTYVHTGISREIWLRNFHDFAQEEKTIYTVLLFGLTGEAIAGRFYSNQLQGVTYSEGDVFSN